MTAPAGPPHEPPLEDLPPDAPATVEDVRAARRWTMVALAWAIAASAIALFALFGQDDDDPAPPPSDNSAAEVTRLERQTRELDERLDAFERRIGNRASQDDVQKLERRLRSAEDDSSEAKQAADRAATTNTEQGERLDDLEQRVEDLESQENQPGGAGDEEPAP